MLVVLLHSLVISIRITAVPGGSLACRNSVVFSQRILVLGGELIIPISLCMAFF